MRHRRLTGAVLLGASLLLVAERSHADGPPAGASPQRTVIATSVPVTTDVPAPLPPNLPAVPLTRPAAPPAAPSGIQQAAFVPGAPPPPPTPPERRLPANGLLLPSPSPAPSTPAPSPAPSPAPIAPMPTPPAPTPAPAPTPPPSPAGPTPGTGLVSGLPSGTPSPSVSSGPTAAPAVPAALVSVEVTGPERLSLGGPWPHEIVVQNKGMRSAVDVHVEEAMPAGARLVRAEPPATVQGERLSWDLGTLEAGAQRRLKVEVQPATAGEVVLRPSVTFADAGGLHAQVIRPQFAVEMHADHDKVTRDGRIAFTIRVTNNGDTLVHNIQLTDNLPAGLRHPAGTRVGIPHFGDLPPHESRSVKLETTAVQAGRLRNEVVAQADGGISGTAAVEVEVSEPTLSLRLDGPKRGLTRRDLDFNLEVANPGPTLAKKIHLIQALPPSFEGVAASTGGSFDPTLHAYAWTLGELAPGQRQTVTFRVRAGAAGDWPLYTAVLADNVPETRASNVLHIDASTALSLEIHAHEDRLNVGAETIYELRVLNQGDASCAGVRLTATLPDEVTPLDGQGPVAGQVNRQQVQFPTLAQLPPHGDAVYRIRVRGQKAGRGSVRVELAAERQQSLQRELSIQVNTGTATAVHTSSTTAEDLR